MTDNRKARRAKAKGPSQVLSPEMKAALSKGLLAEMELAFKAGFHAGVLFREDNPNDKRVMLEDDAQFEAYRKYKKTRTDLF